MSGDNQQFGECTGTHITVAQGRIPPSPPSHLMLCACSPSPPPALAFNITGYTVWSEMEKSERRGGRGGRQGKGGREGERRERGEVGEGGEGERGVCGENTDER